MDASIWSQLPLDILLCVMHESVRNYETADERTQLWRFWAAATENNRVLQHALISEYWSAVEIRWSDLWVDEKTDPTRHQWTSFDEIQDVTERIRNLLSRLRSNQDDGFVKRIREGEHGLPSFVPHIQSLTLRLAQLKEDREDFSPPSHRMVEYTLQHILPDAKRLNNFYVIGPASSTILSVLAASECRRTLRYLSVQDNFWTPRCLAGIDQTDLHIYNWTQLNGLSSLEELVVGQVNAEEIHSLTPFIASLPRLLALTLGASEDKRLIRGHCPDFVPESSPLQALFQGGGSKNILATLPASVISLQINEAGYSGPLRLQVPACRNPQRQRHSRSVLTELMTGLYDVQSTANILTWLPQAQIQRIRFSPWLEGTDSQTSSSLDLVVDVGNSILTEHHSTLREMRILHAWRLHEDYAPEFHRRWGQQFALTDLILGTHSMRAEHCAEPHVDSQRQTLKHALFGCNENINRWGSSLQRIRLEMPSIGHDIDIKGDTLLPYSSLYKLRILILNPRFDCAPQGFGQSVYTGEVYHRFPRCNHFPFETSECDRLTSVCRYYHGVVANALVNEAPMSLRLIQVCQFKFWVDPESRGPGKGFEAVLVPWEQVLNDERLKKETEEWLSKDDLDFLDNNSLLNVDRQHMVGSNPLETLDRDYMGGFNFLVARPVR